MPHFLATLAVVAGIAALLGPTPASPPAPSPSHEILAMLDPGLPGRLACGQRGGGRSLDRHLRLAAAYASTEPGAATATLPLYRDIAASQLAPPQLAGAARSYFDQGLMLTYGFNHAGAIRSFREARRLAPDCALCGWGVALAIGPNINAAMDQRRNAEALAELAAAQRSAAAATPEAGALIDALALRYSADPKADRFALDGAYADAMIGAARRFPGNDDIALLAAEAAMDTSPWNYWDASRRSPNSRVAEAVALVEAVLARRPKHPQAAHLYIHLMENYAEPGRAERAADLLTGSAPGALGHLVHMPGHIYYRVGRYADSIRANVAAARADERYLALVGDDGTYRYGYYPHNVHFLLTSAQMAGDLRTTLREAARLRTILGVETAKDLAWVQAIHAAPAFAVAQFGTPAQVLAQTSARSELPYVAAMNHYARAVARARQGKPAEFARELAAMTGLRDAPGVKAMAEQGVPAGEIVDLAAHVARGRMAYATRHYGAAAEHYRRAIAIEAALPYNEPPYWYYPVSQSLGAALYRGGRYEEAATAFRAALFQAPNNGWALWGLAQTERKLGHKLEAAAAEAALRRSWLGNRNWLRMERL
ncbi:MAG TPA: hypothetical protein VM055_05040 [Novosphingobium sp.]|nr:hypothetical protein [Novosphingobium sp.]